MTATETLQVGAEQASFVMLPRWLLHAPEVSDGAKILYCMLHDLVAGREGPTRPVTRAQLGHACGVSVDTVDRRMAELVAASAVEKRAQVPSGGQVANVYQVWLTPPQGLARSPFDGSIPTGNGRRRESAAPVKGWAQPQVNRSRESAAAPGPQPCGNRRRDDAAPKALEEQEEELPPQPPRTTGGPEWFPIPPGTPAVPSKRAAGTNPRANGAHPRADEERAEAARQQAEDERARAEVAAQMFARRSEAEEAARTQAQALAEQLALSAVLDDQLLDRLVDHVRAGLPGPLARSPFAVARSVVVFCRRAQAARPGDLPGAMEAALVEEPLQPAEGDVPPPSILAPPPPGTRRLQERIQVLLASGEETLS